jgi:hypothetical protein
MATYRKWLVRVLSNDRYWCQFTKLCSGSWCALRLLLPVGVLDEQAEQLGVRAVRSFYLFATS